MAMGGPPVGRTTSRPGAGRGAPAASEAGSGMVAVSAGARSSAGVPHPARMAQQAEISAIERGMPRR